MALTNKERLELANNIVASGFDIGTGNLPGKVSETETFINNAEKAVRNEVPILNSDRLKKMRGIQKTLTNEMHNKYMRTGIDKILADKSMDENFTNDDLRESADDIRRRFGDLRLTKEEAINTIGADNYDDLKQTNQELYGDTYDGFEVEDMIYRYGGDKEKPAYGFFDVPYKNFKKMMPMTGGIAPSTKKDVLQKLAFYNQILSNNGRRNS